MALEKAAKLARGRHIVVDFVQVDILDWAWPRDAFDAVVGIFIQFVGPADRACLLAGMKSAVKPGCLLFLHGYTPKQLEYGTGGPSAVENLYTEALLREAFSDWEIVLLREHDDLIEEGTAHSGRSALIDLVARGPATGR